MTEQLGVVVVPRRLGARVGPRAARGSAESSPSAAAYRDGSGKQDKE